MNASASQSFTASHSTGARVILLAAGKGSRMKGAVDDKILVPIEGKSSFRRSYEAFAATAIFDRIVVVYRDEEQRAKLADDLSLSQENGNHPEILWTPGGALRQDSVFAGLTTAGIDTEYIFIHDCARPLVRPDDIRALFEAVIHDRAASLARPLTDTIKRVNRRRTHFRKCQLREIDRRGCWSMETPQAFDYNLIFDAYQKARQEPTLYTDDTSIAAADDHKVTLVEPSFPNPKITRPGDLTLAAFLVRNPDFNQGEA